jgi:hypothetical protein
LIALALVWACGDDSEESSSTSGGGAPAGSNACSSCIAEACTTAVDACAADQTCSAYLACLSACPEDGDGLVDPACILACPAPTTDPGTSAFEQLNVCRAIGEGARCASCGATTQHADPAGVLGQMCPDSTDPNACYACEDESCCETWAAYDASPEAKTFFECFRTCLQSNGEGCVQPCYEAHPGGFELAAKRWACLQVYCVDEGVCNSGPLAPCVACGNQYCAAPFVELITNPAGFIFTYQCTPFCAPGDKPCIDACLEAYPQAAPLFDAWTSCVVSQCGPECG